MGKWGFWVAVILIVWIATYIAKTFAAQSNTPSVKGFFGGI